MKKTTYFPADVWNYSIFASTVIRGIFACFFAYEWIDVFIVMIVQFFVGFTLLLPFFFLWIFITNIILKKFEDERTLKTGFTYLAILFSITIYQLVKLVVSDFVNYFHNFDAMSFGIIMVLFIWILTMRYEFPPVSEDDQSDILDNNIDFS